MPNTPSTIVVTVKNQAGVVYRKGRIVFGITLSKQLFNLDTGRHGKQLALRDAELYRRSRIITAINGTEVSRWTRKATPTLANCASIPAADWSTTLEGLVTVITVGDTWCVHTSQHRYGVIVDSDDFENEFLHALWKKPSDL